MLDDSFFISATIHEKEVELPDGKKHKLHFKELPHVDFARFQVARNSDDKEERAASVAGLITASLCEANGKPAITLEKALTLKPEAADALFAAVMTVSRPTKKKG